MKFSKRVGGGFKVIAEEWADKEGERVRIYGENSVERQFLVYHEVGGWEVDL